MTTERTAQAGPANREEEMEATPTVSGVRSDPRVKVQTAFRKLSEEICGSSLNFYDYTVSQIEDLVVTMLGKMDPDISTINFRYTEEKKVTIEVNKVKKTETKDFFPMRKFKHAAPHLVVELIPKNLFAAFFNALKTDLGLRSRKEMEMACSNLIVRCARRQDILYNKNVKIMVGQSSYKLEAVYTPLFKGHQTFERFKSLISNHTGVGTNLLLLLSARQDQHAKKAAARLTKRLVNVEQQNLVRAMSSSVTMSGIGLQTIKTFLDSCFVFMPREKVTFLGNPFFVCQNSEDTFTKFINSYERATDCPFFEPVICGSVPWWFVEFMVMTSAYTDQMGVIKYMTGMHYYRKDLDLDDLKVLQGSLPQNFRYLKPLKGSATSVPSSGAQKNTVLAVHGKRKLTEEDYSWMDLNVQFGINTTDALSSLTKAIAKRISDTQQGVPVCQYDEEELSIQQGLGYWNN